MPKAGRWALRRDWQGDGGTEREVNYRAPFINSLNGALERWFPLTLASLKAFA